MSSGESQIRCRKCKEIVALEGGSCPHCGTAFRSVTKLAVAFVIGLFLSVFSLFEIGQLWFFMAIGLAMMGISGFLIYDRRQREDIAAHETVGDLE